SFPCFFGIAVIAPDAVPLILGPKWTDAVAPIQFLSIAMPLRFIDVLFGPVITGKGRPGIMAGNMLVAIIIMPAAFLIGAQWGIVGLCYAWVLAYPVLFAFMLMRVLKVLEISLGRFLREVCFPLLSSVVMVVCLYAFHLSFSESLGSLGMVAASILLGAGIYAGATLTLNRSVVRDFKLMFSTT
ncbi:MAG: hypothetical protein C4519_21530, partial [Desulfobacteraceae bacterium]